MAEQIKFTKSKRDNVLSTLAVDADVLEELHEIKRATNLPIRIIVDKLLRYALKHCVIVEDDE
ncbi:hypothetical protein JDW15_04260 [Aerococcaceae bacterium zg-ZJ1578]|uniref:hypothetical protein n=1 Tax=Aerococcaceae bacterium zg-252 TaxID=2796928 RepID=UPI001A274F45|nr:hypothetical protein [Aerococcaceae bacterium zg-1578]MBR7928408.1 hypothetical protein [Aerococcaceae bacterium zg-ZUI334]MBS4461202.1 hypothetical protein [Aerococcaceae bacterium zg-B36]